MAQKTNKVLLSTDDKDLSEAEIKRKKVLIDKQSKKETKEETTEETTEEVVEEVVEETTEETTEEVVEEKESTVDIVKAVRVEIDRVHTLCNKEFMTDSEVVVAIFFGKSWLGKLLSFLDNPNPYANEDKIKDRNDIPPTADVYVVKDYHSEIFQFNLKNKLDKVLILRKELGLLIDLVEKIEIIKDEVSDVRLASICKTNAYIQLSQAKFLLGNELAKLKTQ